MKAVDRVCFGHARRAHSSRQHDALLKLIIARPCERSVAVLRLIPPMPIIAGYGAVPVVGSCTVAVNEIDVVPSPAVTEICVLETVPETTAGFGGLSPSS